MPSIDGNEIQWRLKLEEKEESHFCTFSFVLEHSFSFPEQIFRKHRGTDLAEAVKGSLNQFFYCAIKTEFGPTDQILYRQKYVNDYSPFLLIPNEI